MLIKNVLEKIQKINEKYKYTLELDICDKAIYQEYTIRTKTKIHGNVLHCRVFKDDITLWHWVSGVAFALGV